MTTPPLKVYVACRYGRRERGRDLARAIESAGHVVTSRWLGPSGDEPAPDMSPDEVERLHAIQARIDLEDVYAANVLVLITENFYLTEKVALSGGSGGGRHFEAGFATALRKPVILLGRCESVFHRLPSFLHAASVDELTGALGGIQVMRRLNDAAVPF